LDSNERSLFPPAEALENRGLDKIETLRTVVGSPGLEPGTNRL